MAFVRVTVVGLSAVVAVVSVVTVVAVVTVVLMAVVVVVTVVVVPVPLAHVDPLPVRRGGRAPAHHAIMCV
ncbi:hypothetical protein [Streptomyces sp. NPDC059894]|uniref:hypothetical protein n=1 Tax=unclassified Streptomyces TaxID=2593676 RepID=UPI003651B4F2